MEQVDCAFFSAAGMASHVVGVWSSVNPSDQTLPDYTGRADSDRSELGIEARRKRGKPKGEFPILSTGLGNTVSGAGTSDRNPSGNQ